MILLLYLLSEKRGEARQKQNTYFLLRKWIRHDGGNRNLPRPDYWSLLFGVFQPCTFVIHFIRGFHVAMNSKSLWSSDYIDWILFTLISNNMIYPFLLHTSQIGFPENFLKKSVLLERWIKVEHIFPMALPLLVCEPLFWIYFSFNPHNYFEKRKSYEAKKIKEFSVTAKMQIFSQPYPSWIRVPPRQGSPYNNYRLLIFSQGKKEMMNCKVSAKLQSFLKSENGKLFLKSKKYLLIVFRVFLKDSFFFVFLCNFIYE